MFLGVLDLTLISLRVLLFDLFKFFKLDYLNFQIDELEKSGLRIGEKEALEEEEFSAIQAAYNMGGMTLAVSRIEHENAGYTENKDAHNTIFAATMAF